jgi:Helix-turn-helix domain
MAAPRRVIALVSDAAQRQQLQDIARSRTGPASGVERARIVLRYLAEPSASAVARAVGVTAQTVSRCLDRAAELGVIEALDDRQHRPRSDDYRGGENLAGGAGLPKAEGVGVFARVVDDAAAGRAGP